MGKYVLESTVVNFDVSVEDGGVAKIVDVENGKYPRLWIQIKSWDEDKQHPELKDIVGKKITVTIEIED